MLDALQVLLAVLRTYTSVRDTFNGSSKTLYIDNNSQSRRSGLTETIFTTSPGLEKLKEYTIKLRTWHSVETESCSDFIKTLCCRLTQLHACVSQLLVDPVSWQWQTSLQLSKPPLASVMLFAWKEQRTFRRNLDSSHLQSILERFFLAISYLLVWLRNLVGMKGTGRRLFTSTINIHHSESVVKGSFPLEEHLTLKTTYNKLEHNNLQIMSVSSDVMPWLEVSIKI